MQGQTALVTGAAKRIGRAIALALADEGVNIVVHYNTSRDEAEELAHLLEEKGVKAWIFQADFGLPEHYHSMIRHVVELAGSVDILVNSASIFPTDKIADVTFESLISNMQINAWAPFVFSRSFAEEIGCGAIINLIDSRITGYDWNHVAYIWSKHVLYAMTRMLALEFAPEITVNGIAPGLILPPPGKDESYIKRLEHTVPLKKHGEAEDIAEAAVFLIKSSFITGHVIYVDGGRHLKEYADGQNPH